MADSKNLTKAMLPSESEMIRNFLAWYALAQSNPQQFERGKRWYSDANHQCRELQEWANDELGLSITFHETCQFVSAISPGTSWKTNLSLAQQALTAYSYFTSNLDRRAYLSSERYMVGYTWQNTFNAFDCADGQDIPVTRNKTFAFADNLEHPTDAEHDFSALTIEEMAQFIAIDQHMIHVLANTRCQGSINPGRYYKCLAIALVKACLLLGIDPRQGQSAVWNFRVESFEAGHSVESLCELIDSLLEMEEIL